MNLSYPFICAHQKDIPEEALSHIDKSILAGIGGTFTDIFPLFSKSFESTARVIDTVWNKPKLAIQKGAREWVSYIVVQSSDNNLFFLLQPVFVEKEGQIFDEDYHMLPTSWKEIYRWFNSFCMTDNSYCPMDWWNTPFRYSARLDLEDYEQGSGASRKDVEKLVSSIGCEREDLRFWLLTESLDALFINEKACDGRVFHIKGRNMDVITELVDPRKKMDEYLAYYLSRKKLEGFSFLD